MRTVHEPILTCSIFFRKRWHGLYVVRRASIILMSWHRRWRPTESERAVLSGVIVALGLKPDAVMNPLPVMSCP